MKVRMTREDYTKGMTLLMSAEGGIEVYASEDNAVIRGFSGRRAKSDFYYSFKNAAEATAYAEKYVADKMKNVAESKTDVEVKIGEVFVCSWGWEMTSVDFYKVVGVSGSFVSLKKIGAKKAYDSDMTGRSYPDFEKESDEPVMRRKISGGRSGVNVKINSYAYAYKEDVAVLEQNVKRFSEYG